MITALISRLVILAFGTLYPAYASYKAVRTKDVKEYVKWMMYWIVFALFTCLETFTDVLFSFWFPFYYELKVAIVFWLLSPATKGSSFLYRNFVHPAFLKRESEIDEYLSSAKEKGYTTVMNIGTKGVTYATNVIVQTAIKGGGGIFEQIRKSYSLSDLSPKGAEIRASRQLSSQLDADTTDMSSDPRPLPRGRRGLVANPSVDMYFSEVDLNVRQYHGNEPLGEIRSTEDISSGYSSTDQLYAGGESMLLRTSSVMSGRGRGRAGRVSTARRPPLVEGYEGMEREDLSELTVPPGHFISSSGFPNPEKMQWVLVASRDGLTYQEVKPDYLVPSDEPQVELSPIPEDNTLSKEEPENKSNEIVSDVLVKRNIEADNERVLEEAKEVEVSSEVVLEVTKPVDDLANFGNESSPIEQNVDGKSSPSVDRLNNLISELQKTQSAEEISLENSILEIERKAEEKLSELVNEHIRSLTPEPHTVQAKPERWSVGEDFFQNVSKEFNDFGSTRSLTDSEAGLEPDDKRKGRYRKHRAPVPPNFQNLAESRLESITEPIDKKEAYGGDEDVNSFEDAEDTFQDEPNEDVLENFQDADENLQNDTGSSVVNGSHESSEGLTKDENTRTNEPSIGGSNEHIPKYPENDAVSKKSGKSGSSGLTKFITRNAKSLFSWNKKEGAPK